jgi:hypothetical protein
MESHQGGARLRCDEDEAIKERKVVAAQRGENE